MRLSRLSRRSALAWAVVFLVLAFAGGGGTDLLPDSGDGSGSNQAGTGVPGRGRAAARARRRGWSTATP